MSVKEAAEILGVSDWTITRWCKSGKLAALPQTFGKKTTFTISPQAVALKFEELKEELQKETSQADPAPSQTVVPHKDFVAQWEQSMSCGLLKGRAYSQRTIDDYKRYADMYFKKYTAVSVDGLKSELSAIPANNFAKREHYYKAILCLGRFLISEEVLNQGFVEEMKPMYPKRHLPPKRAAIDEEGLNKLLSACDTIQEKLIITLLANTGLRASEACSLKWSDVNLEKGFLTVQCGKGGKRRHVGLCVALVEALTRQWHTIGNAGLNRPVLLNRDSLALDARGLFHRVEQVAIRAKIKASPHILRRAFVTINANKGHPLQMLQRACGHSSIKTTMSYCMTTEQEVIDAMKDW